MLRKRTFRVNDVEYAMIQAYAKSKGLSVSSFIRQVTLGEIQRHIPKKGLRETLRPIMVSILEKELSYRFPVRGKLPEGKKGKNGG